MAAKRKLDPFRRALYAKIAIAQKALGIDDGTYRDLLEARYGKRSRTRLGNAQLVDLIEYFVEMGFKPSAPARGRHGAHRPLSTPSEDRAPLIGKIMAQLGDRPVAYAEGILKHMYGDGAPSRLEWANPPQLRKVVAALAYDAKRKAALAEKRAEVLAIWHRLGHLGVLSNPSDFGLNGWISHRIVPRDDALENLTSADLDKAARLLGDWLRREQEKRERDDRNLDVS